MIDWSGTTASTPAPAPDDDLPPVRTDAGPTGWRAALEIPLLLVTAAVIALLVKAFLAQAFFIPSASMEPQLTAGDRVVVSRLSYRFHEPNRGDVIVFDDPTGTEPAGGFLPVRLGREALEALGVIRPQGRELIKRIVGLPGEDVSGVGGHIVIDGRILYEPYLPDTVIISDFGPVTVPEHHLFVMGDNRTNSRDSRVFGPIDQDLIVGRALAHVWPPGRLAFL